MPFRSRPVWTVHQRGLIVWLCALLLGPVAAMAQAPQPGDKEGAASPRSEVSPDLPDKPTSQEKDAAASVDSVSPKQGRPGPIDDSDSVNEGVPDFHIAKVALDGEVSGDRAFITAQMDIDVNRENADSASTAFHDVALRLTQAHILSKEYSGPGKEGPVLDLPVEDGIVWRFSGHGTHRLTLKMWVPIRQSPAGRQLVLSLPTMPPGFDAQLKLQIPGPAIVVRSNRDLSVLSNERVAESNHITADVRGTRLDLTWSEPPEAQTSFVQSTSSMTLRRIGDRVEATADQVLVPENAGVREVDIKLPDGFELEELSGPMIRGHEPILGRNGWRKIKFRETGGERIDLKWILSAPFPVGGGTFQLDGLVVPDARGQIGRIMLNEFPGYQLVPRPGQFVRRIPSTAPQVAEAFEFTKQPFRITWDVQRVAPKFSVRPRHLLFVSTNQLTLDCRFRIQTDVGSLDQAVIEWGAGMGEGWKFVPSTTIGEITISSNGDQLNQSGQLLVEWKTPQTGATDLDVRFQRMITSDVPTAIVGLPQIRGARTQPAELVLAAEDHLEVSVTPQTGAAPSPNLNGTHRLEGVPPRIIGQIQQVLLIEPDQRQVALSWKPQPRVIEAEAEIELRRESAGRVRLAQTVRFDAKYGRLSSVRFQLPPALVALIPAGSEGSAFEVTVAGEKRTPRIREGVIEAVLPEPLLGEILTTLEYSLPINPDRTAVTEFPILASLDAKYRVTRVRIPEGEPLRVSPSTEGWQPVPTAPNATVWISTTETQIPLQRDVEKNTSPRFRVDRAFYRTRFDPSGHVEGVCELHWTGDVRGMPITLPGDCEILNAVFNGVRLDPSSGQITIDAAQPSQLLFRFPPSSESSRLAFHYRSTQGTPFSNRDLRRAPLPQLPQDVTVVRSIWELDLPAGRHLFMGPRDLTPEHAWRRQGVFWSRLPYASYLQEREEMTVEARQLIKLPSAAGCYVYSSIGPLTPPRFQSMARSMILLLGAGITLALGFLFWSIPASRNMLALLLLAFGISLLSLWYLEPIQLLLQPAILGAVLAILASWIDLRSRRGSLSSLVTPSPSIMLSPPNGGDRSMSKRGSSIVSQRSSTALPTAIYQPGSSEVGRP